MSPEEKTTTSPRYMTYEEYRKKFYGSVTDPEVEKGKYDGPASFSRRIVREN